MSHTCISHVAHMNESREACSAQLLTALNPIMYVARLTINTKGLNHMCDMDSFMCVTRLIHICDMTHSYVLKHV